MLPDHLERAFLQGRVARFALVIGVISAVGLLVRIAVHVAIFGDAAALVGPSFVCHWLAPGVLLAVWATLRRGVWSERGIHRCEEVGLLLHASAYAVLTTQLDVEARPEYVGLLVLVLVMMGRAVYVPSTPRRTLTLTLAIGATFLATSWADYNWWRGAEAGIPAHAAFTRPLTAAIWWAFATTLCTVATSVIYGLRLEVRRANRLGQYTLEQPIGRGGMGIVYRARHAMLRRPTAIKLLLPKPGQAARLARFEREVQLTSQLSHPNTVTVYDYGRTPEGIFFYAMEYLDGADLEAVVAVGGPMPASRVIRVLSQVAGALAEAHDAGLIHRDVKPANILLTEQGGELDVAKIVDFGLLKWMGRDEVAHPEARLLGTPHYIAPEAIESADDVGPAADLYSLGAVGYFLLTGAPLFEADDLSRVLEAHRREPPPSPGQRLQARMPGASGVPADLESIVLSCLAKSPEDRPKDALELRAWLLACEDAFDWTHEDARAWWDLHGAALATDRTRRLEAARSVTEQALPTVPLGPPGRGPVALSGVRRVVPISSSP